MLSARAGLCALVLPALVAACHQRRIVAPAPDVARVWTGCYTLQFDEHGPIPHLELHTRIPFLEGAYWIGRLRNGIPDVDGPQGQWIPISRDTVRIDLFQGLDSMLEFRLGRSADTLKGEVRFASIGDDPNWRKPVVGVKERCR